MYTMKIENLSDKAPLKGQILAYFRNKFLFERYDDVTVIEKMIEEKQEDLLELHLFDAQKEYRCVLTRSKRAEEHGIIEHIADFEDSKDEVYKETVLLEDGSNLVILNHICYQEENGMAVIDDYRMKMGGSLE